MKIVSGPNSQSILNKYTDVKKINIIFFSTLLLSIFFCFFICALFLNQIYKIEEEITNIKRSDTFLFETSKIFKSIIDSENGVLGFMATGDEAFLESWNASLVNLNPDIENLIRFSKNNLEHAQSFQRINHLYNEWRNNRLINIEFKRETEKTGQVHVIELKKNVMDEIRAIFNVLSSREEALRLERLDRLTNVLLEGSLDLIFLGILLGLVQGLISWTLLNSLSSHYKMALDSLYALSERLRKMFILKNEKLKDVTKEFKELSFFVSHDLRIPLRGVDGIGRIIREEYSDRLDGGAIRYLDLIHQGVIKMQLLLDEVINFSQLALLEFRPEEINLSFIAAAIMEDLRNEVPQRKVEFINFDPFFVTADRIMMSIALKHLLTNAWMYSKMRDITIIELGKKNERGGDIYFVKDNGVGFGRPCDDKLFRPFQKIHFKENFINTGTDLAKVAKIIQRHGGKIWAESKLNEHAIIYFSLDARSSAR